MLVPSGEKKAARGRQAKAESARPLSWRIIAPARIQALRRFSSKNLRGGVILGDSEEDRRLRHTRERVPVDCFDHDAVMEAKLDGHWAYGGVTHRHFGHFMAEMVHRIVPSMHHDPRQPFVIVSTVRNPEASFEDLPGFIQQTYSFLGLTPETVHVVTRDTLVESLFVSESGSDLKGGPKESYLDLLDAYTARKLDELFGSARTGKKLYVSRSKLSMHGGLCGEKYMEAALEAEGFEVFHPQDHPIAMQMDQYRKAGVVMFLEGSACHGVELLGRNAMQGCILLKKSRASLGSVGRFDAVLEPRAQDYWKCESSIYLGTVFKAGESRQAKSKGISIVNWDGLMEFLRNAGAGRLSSGSKDGYLAAASEDLSRYLATAAPHGREKSTELVARLVTRFQAAKQAA